MHPLTGIWTANLAKSDRDPNHQFQGASMEFEIEGESVLLTYRGADAGGEVEQGSRTFRADGQERPDPAAPGIVAVSTMDARTVQVTARRDGAVVGSGAYEVSDDGSTMTATMSGIDRAGRQFEQVIVFDRQ